MFLLRSISVHHHLVQNKTSRDCDKYRNCVAVCHNVSLQTKFSLAVFACACIDPIRPLPPPPPVQLALAHHMATQLQLTIKTKDPGPSLAASTHSRYWDHLNRRSASSGTSFPLHNTICLFIVVRKYAKSIEQI